MMRKRYLSIPELVQGFRTRLGSNSFLINGWGMTGVTIKSAVALGLIVCAIGGGSAADNPEELPVAAFDAVVVTATRVEMPLQQVPLSISALTGADLERRGIGNPYGAGELDARFHCRRSGCARQQRHHRPWSQHGFVERIGVQR